MSFIKSEDLGRALLKRSEEENLQDLLSSLRETVINNSSTRIAYFGFPALDRILTIFGQHGTTPQKPPVLELTSVAPASGKTQLLYLLIAAAILPETVSNDPHLKDPVAVVILDTDGTFNVGRLKQLMLSSIDKSLSEGVMEKNRLDSIVENALRHVHIFIPQSFSTLVSTIQYLPEYLLNPENHSSENRALDLLVLDSVSSFFWQQNFAEETAGQDFEEQAESNEDISNYRGLVQALRHVQQRFGAAIVATQWGLSSLRRNRSDQAPSLRSLLPLSWQGFCTLRLVLERDRVKRFPHGISVDQALNEADDRQAVMDQSKFTGRVALFDVDHRNDGLRAQLTLHPLDSSFSFRVTECGAFAVS